MNLIAKLYLTFICVALASCQSVVEAPANTLAEQIDRYCDLHPGVRYAVRDTVKNEVSDYGHQMMIFCNDESRIRLPDDQARKDPDPG